MRPWKVFGFELSTPDRFTPISIHSSISPLGFWSPVARHWSLPSWPRVTASPVTGRESGAMFIHLSPLECALAEKRACNSFAMRTYKSLDLKSLGINTYKKHRGGYPSLQFSTLNFRLLPLSRAEFAESTMPKKLQLNNRCQHWEHALGQALRNLRRSKSSRLAETVLKQITQASSDNSRAAS